MAARGMIDRIQYSLTLLAFTSGVVLAACDSAPAENGSNIPAPVGGGRVASEGQVSTISAASSDTSITGVSGSERKPGASSAADKPVEHDLSARTVSGGGDRRDTGRDEGVRDSTGGGSSTGQHIRPEPGESGVIRVGGSTAGVRSLLIVNGARVETLEGIDPNQIDTYEVLRGQDAVRRYGPDAAAGVTIITTKP